MINVRIAVGIACLALLCLIFTYQRDRAVTANGAAGSDTLEREFRIGLPLGSSLPTVENFLRNRGIEFSSEGPPRSVLAVARKLKGSTISTSKSLTLQFHFDEAWKLKELDAKVLYTGL